MADFANIESAIVADNELFDGYALDRLRARFGNARGRALGRLAQGLRDILPGGYATDPTHQTDDILLTALADAILLPDPE